RGAAAPRPRRARPGRRALAYGVPPPAQGRPAAAAVPRRGDSRTRAGVPLEGRAARVRRVPGAPPRSLAVLPGRVDRPRGDGVRGRSGRDHALPRRPRALRPGATDGVANRDGVSPPITRSVRTTLPGRRRLRPGDPRRGRHSRSYTLGGVSAGFSLRLPM